MTVAIPPGDNGAAIAFLEEWRPGGPWVLTAIKPDRSAIKTDTFRTADLDDLGEWLDKYNGKRNLYFHVNSTLRDLTKKAKKTDIASVHWLHVDIDPRVGESLDDERERVLALLKDKLPKGVPAPTVIIFSGGGYQGFWKLAEPIVIDGDLAKAEEAECYTRKLELLFGADNCHNVDRIMRLPGTVNLPDARKLKKGRVPTLAKLVSFEEDRVYPLGEFTKAKPVASAWTPDDEEGKIEIAGRFDAENEYRGVDVYAARCAVLHTWGAEAAAHRKDPTIRQFGYTDGGLHYYAPDVSDRLVLIGVPSLINDLVIGVESFLTAAKNDADLRERLNSRIEKVMQIFPFPQIQSGAGQ